MAGKQRQNEAALIAALAAGETVADAARQAGVSERTAHRRLADPEFCSRVTKARADMLGQAVGVLSLACTTAAKTLTELLSDKSSMVRLSAAKAILESRQKLWEGTELESRLAAIEQRAAGLPAAGGRDGEDCD